MANFGTRVLSAVVIGRLLGGATLLIFPLRAPARAILGLYVARWPVSARCR